MTTIVNIFSDGVKVRDQASNEERCAVIAYDNGEFVYSARQWTENQAYICQVQQQGMHKLEKFAGTSTCRPMTALTHPDLNRNNNCGTIDSKIYLVRPIFPTSVCL